MKLLVGVELVVSGLDLSYQLSITRYTSSEMSLHHGHPELMLGGNLPCDLLGSDVGI